MYLRFPNILAPSISLVYSKLVPTISRASMKAKANLTCQVTIIAFIYSWGKDLLVSISHINTWLEMSRTRKLFILILALIVIAVSFYYILSYAQAPSNPYTKLSIQAGSYQLYQTNQNKWQIFYYPENSSATISYPAYILIMDSKGNYQSYNATPQGSYDWDGLQIQVSALYSDHIELLVKPSS